MYVNYKIASAVTPNKKLKGFREVPLSADVEKRARTLANAAELGVWTNRYVVQKGEFVIAVGDSEKGKSRASV